MEQAEGLIAADSIDLNVPDYFGVVTMAAAIGPCLGLYVFPFFAGIKTELMQEGTALTCHRDRNFCSKLNVAPCPATHDRLSMCLFEADYAVRNAPAIRVVKNVLLTHQLAENQMLLVDVSISGQKACTTGG